MSDFDDEIRNRLKMEDPELPDHYSKRIDSALSDAAQYEDEKHGNSFRFRAAMVYVVIFFIVSAGICASMNYHHMSDTAQKSIHPAKSVIEPDSDGDQSKVSEKPDKSNEAPRIIEQKYDVAKYGEQIEDATLGDIRFSNEKIVCYSRDEDIKTKKSEETFYIYDRKTGKSHHILTMDYNTAWGDMYEKDDCLYYAVGLIKENGKETSSILKIDEKTFQGEITEIKGCNTELSRVVCTDDTVYVWYIKKSGKKGNIEEYYLCSLEDNKLKPVDSWTFEARTEVATRSGTGQIMSTMGTNGKELFCYVAQGNGDAVVNIYGKNGKKNKSIPINFTDFQKRPDEEGGEDIFWDLYCCGNTLFFQTLDHRILVAEYDGETIQRAEYDFGSEAGNPENKKFDIGSGDYMAVKSFSDKMLICGRNENTEKLYIWDTASERINCMVFQVKYATDYNYMMLSENEVIVSAVNGTKGKSFYCPFR